MKFIYNSNALIKYRDALYENSWIFFPRIMQNSIAQLCISLGPKHQSKSFLGTSDKKHFYEIENRDIVQIKYYRGRPYKIKAPWRDFAIVQFIIPKVPES